MTIIDADTTPIVESDPHGLRASGERIAGPDTLWDRLRVTVEQLRTMRRARSVRYIDRWPDVPPGRWARSRYMYSLRDVEREATKMQSAPADAEPVPPPAPTKTKSAPPPSKVPTPHRASATRRRPAMPEVVFVRRRAS